MSNYNFYLFRPSLSSNYVETFHHIYSNNFISRELKVTEKMLMVRKQAAII